MGIKMKNAPVYFTVAQVRFNTVLNLESYLPAIQDEMREKHFPGYKVENLQRISLPFNSSETEPAAGPSVLSQSRYIFSDIEDVSGFVLENSTLSFQTTTYDTFETFSENFFNGLEILNKFLHLDFTERVGLRYLDAVLPDADKKETLENYLAPEVLGLSQKLPGKMIHSVSETASLNAAGQIISRVIIQNGKVGLPPELTTLAPKINARFTLHDGCHAIIDTDAFSEQREVFDINKLQTRLIALHEEVLNSFKVTVTSHALKTWDE